MQLKSNKKKLSIWLAKVPRYLGVQILGMAKGSVIGSLGIDRTPAGATLDLQLSPAMLGTGIPSKHIVEVKEREKVMCLVSQGKSMEVEGIVNKEVFIRPEMTAEYLDFKRRMKTTEEEKVKIMDYFTEVKRSGKYSMLKEMDVLARKRKQMLQDKKRERLEKEDVMEMVFNAFERHERWTVKDLADFSGQPVAYIQDIVDDICVLNKKDHRNAYELKPEYRNH